MPAASARWQRPPLSHGLPVASQACERGGRNVPLPCGAARRLAPDVPSSWPSAPFAAVQNTARCSCRQPGTLLAPTHHDAPPGDSMHTGVANRLPSTSFQGLTDQGSSSTAWLKLIWLRTLDQSIDIIGLHLTGCRGAGALVARRRQPSPACLGSLSTKRSAVRRSTVVVAPQHRRLLPSCRVMLTQDTVH